MARSSLHFLSVILLMLSPFLLTSIEAQFGISKGASIQLSENGDQILENAEEGSNSKEGFLSEKDAADMEAILNEAQKDVETMAMITKLKAENADHMMELQKLSPAEILGGMKETLDNLKLIEYLFKDKEKAVKEMEKEGMIDKAHIKKYRKDPDLLEQDTRRGLYFQFISLAVVGGFIE